MSPFTYANTNLIGQDSPVEACYPSGSITAEFFPEQWHNFKRRCGWCLHCRVAHRPNPLEVVGAKRRPSRPCRRG